MDNRRGYNAAPDEERWLFMGRHPCCPPSSEHRDHPAALFDEVERVMLLIVDDHRIHGELGRSSTSKQSRWSDLDEQRLLAYKKEGKSWEWIFGQFPGRLSFGICWDECLKRTLSFYWPVP
jgi:hypothetical protein